MFRGKERKNEQEKNGRKGENSYLNNGEAK